MCIVCDRIDLIKKNENPYFIMELSTGYVVFGDYQRFEGYLLFLCKEHKNELFDLEASFLQQHMQEMLVVAEAANSVFKADKMNYECLGNNCDHVHWHIFSRHDGDMEKNGPVWTLPKAELYPEEYKLTTSFIQTYLPQLITEINNLMRKKEQSL